MTATAAPTADERRVRTPTLPVALQLAGRSIKLMARVPATFIPSLIFPVFTVVAFSGAFSALTRLPGFPTSKMIDWMLPMSVIQGAAFAGVGVGLGTVRDLEGGFYDRLRLAPIPPASLILGPVLAALARAIVPVMVVMGAGLLAGASLRGGVLGVVVLVVAAEGTALAAAGWALGLALRIKTIQSGPLMQVGIFLVTFLSTAQVPLTVMTGWLRAIARVNPMTNVLALGRQGFVGDVTWAGTWPGLVAIAGAGLVLLIFAARGLRPLTN